MKLLTHNMLTSKAIKKVNTGYPLLIEARDVKVSEVEFNPDFISRIIPKVDWDCLRRAAEQLGHLDDLPQATPANYENDEDFLKKAHHALLEIELINGNLVCPETSRKFPVSDGIPNMLLNEDEI
ncbi:multifunctional methyltransferase subunit TRM112-like protein [Eurytemora carolleeae]|uniref:multifunctional methyltransferase subunit TRM112-like protein n=1 Tax=Eurytemora carolleeae TaxID=1294199 RepID=UPI000C77B900|nr:multifunctional methyltransferase subunit TRM112-like protein [Eurytemora carolleeae]|eukprot:XP_023340312.1 multifunctional methyltransferase subunit TRM112-like protein [Eurytemora affinis]